MSSRDAIGEDALSAAGAFCCQSAAANVFVAATAAFMTTALAHFGFIHISLWYGNSRAM